MNINICIPNNINETKNVLSPNILKNKTSSSQNNFTINEINKSCRVCNKNDSTFKSLFTYKIKDKYLQDIFQFCTNITVCLYYKLDEINIYLKYV